MNAEYGDRSEDFLRRIEDLSAELARWKQYAQTYTIPIGRCGKCNFPLNRGYICANCGNDPTTKDTK